MVWIRNAPHTLMCLNTWSLVSGVDGGGYGALEGRDESLGWDFEVGIPAPFWVYPPICF